MQPVSEASLARRLGAAVYDWLLLTALAFVTQFALLPLVTPGHAATATTLAIAPLPLRMLLFCIQLAVFALYCAWFWTRGRRTLAQKTWALRLVDASGASLGPGRALLRFAAAWIGPVLALVAWWALQPFGHARLALSFLMFNYAWALVDPRRAFLHDRLAATSLVSSR